MLNWLCLMLSPIALVVLLGYSYTKRFTVLTHWVLGFALGLAPVGAWMAIRGRLDLLPWLLTAAVTTWTAGFDLIYACQDIAFDREHGLFSIPARWGARRALVISTVNHVFTIWFLALFGYYAGLGWLYFLGVIVLILRCCGMSTASYNRTISARRKSPPSWRMGCSAWCCCCSRRRMCCM